MSSFELSMGGWLDLTAEVNLLSLAASQSAIGSRPVADSGLLGWYLFCILSAVILAGVSHQVWRFWDNIVGAVLTSEAELAAQCTRILAIVWGGLLALGVLAIGSLSLLIRSEFVDFFSAALVILSPGIWAIGAARPLHRFLQQQSNSSWFAPHKVEHFRIAVFVVATTVLFSIYGLSGVLLSCTLTLCVGSGLIAMQFHSISGFSFLENWSWRGVDTKLLRDAIRRTLGRPLKTKVAFLPNLKRNGSHSTDPQTSGDNPVRQVLITPTTVVKQQPSDITNVEWIKTNQGRIVGQNSGLFAVPELLNVDVDCGLLEFRRLFQHQPLWWHLVRNPTDTTAIVHSAKALAAIHDEMRLPMQLRVSLPDCWETVACSARKRSGQSIVGCAIQTVSSQQETDTSSVWLHGDFNNWNIWVHRRTGQLTIIDWATSDRCGGRATVGPYYFDVAWFVISLFRVKYGGRVRIANVESQAERFVEEYTRARQSPVNKREAFEYLSHIFPLVSQSKRVGRFNFRARITRFLNFRLDWKRLDKFAVDMTSHDQPHRRVA